MRRFALVAILGTFLLTLIVAAPAHAQLATRTWVSGVGDDMAACSRTAPCKTFAGAISKTAAGGEINCLDSGGFATLSITKSITIVCDGVVGGILAEGQNSIYISAAATDHIVLKGLDIDAGVDVGGGPYGTYGIRFVSGASLLIQNCVVRRYKQRGILVDSSTPMKLTIIDTVVSHNGNGNTGMGIQLAPTGSGVVRADLSNVTLVNNHIGIQAVGLVNAQIDNSRISNNDSDGVLGNSGGTIRIGSSKIVSNGGYAAAGSAVFSYLDNQIQNNGIDTSPPSAVYK